MATLAAPKAVSPLIRFSRYAALISGLVYGSYKLGSLQKKEVIIQEHENKIRASLAERAAQQKEANLKIEMDRLAKDMGITPKS